MKNKPKKLPKFIDHDLLAQVEKCIADSGLTPTSFGVKSLNDPLLVKDLREGRELRRMTRNRVLSFIAEQTSQGAA